ncbi:MAG: hypothetical protein WAM85_13300 [Terracidiphilus sp.]
MEVLIQQRHKPARVQRIHHRRVRAESLFPAKPTYGTLRLHIPDLLPIKFPSVARKIGGNL